VISSQEEIVLPLTELKNNSNFEETCGMSVEGVFLVDSAGKDPALCVDGRERGDDRPSAERRVGGIEVVNSP
jgi:hypothetical protein